MSLEERLSNRFFDLIVDEGIRGGSDLADRMARIAKDEFAGELQYLRTHAYDGEAVQVRVLELLGARPVGR